MAEGGGNGDEDNPFSFKKFVKTKSSKVSTSTTNRTQNGATGGQNLPDISASMPNERSTSDADSSNENPFSFKKFLKSDVRSQSGGLTTLDLANDLPDFVQDHYSSEQATNRLRTNQPEVQLPDFALELDNASGGAAASQSFLQPSEDVSVLAALGLNDPIEDPLRNTINDGINAINRLDSEDSNGDVSPNPAVSAASGGLPDFLSDNVALNPLGSSLKNGLSLSDDVLGQEDYEDAETELKRVRLENRELRKQLNEAREFSETESKRVAAVLQEMEAIQKREAEETAALENMIQQVEANLQATTHRAVSAEKTIAKLQLELKTLQTSASGLRCENASLRRAGGCDVMRDRAKAASEQIAAAATTAETQLKQLLAGVDSLKLVSNVLASIDKISDTADPAAPDANTPPPPTSTSSAASGAKPKTSAASSTKSRTSPGSNSSSSTGSSPSVS